MACDIFQIFQSHHCLTKIIKSIFSEFFERRKSQGVGIVDQGSRREASTEFSGATRITDEGKDGECQELPLLSFDSILGATRDFSALNLLGEGGFGPVYKVGLHYRSSIF